MLLQRSSADPAGNEESGGPRHHEPKSLPGFCRRKSAQHREHERPDLAHAQQIQGRHVLLVEDIVDSGYTIASVLEFLETRHPASLRVCTLLNKPERREVEVPIHYCGFIIPNKFVFGYGLDMDEFYRNLPFIASVDLSRYNPPDEIS